jgi:twitching motility two-component system response regulator PilG
VELGQRSGELFVEPYFSPASKVPPHPPCWFVFFSNGQIVYATDNLNQLQRLQDYLRRYAIDRNLLEFQQSLLHAGHESSSPALEYSCLWALMDQKIITPTQGRNILQGMIRETLFELLSLHQGKFIFEQSSALSPQLTHLAIGPLLSKTMKQVQQWNQLHAYMSHGEQCPLILNPEQLQAKLKPATFRILQQYSTGQTSLRQIARYLNRDLATVGRAIYPHLEQGLIQLSSPPPHGLPQSFTPGLDLLETLPMVASRRSLSEIPIPSTPHIVCIDDGATIREAVDAILREQGYRSSPLDNPVQALSQVFQLKPDLILCDIAMPELDGYEVCAMLRQSASFRQIPIIMLTGKDGFIDRVRARSVGATDYLTKPFKAEELLTLVEKYVGPGYPEEPMAFQQLADLLDNTLGTGLRRTEETSQSG